MDILMLWLDILLPILAIAIPVFATVYTVNNRIKNENQENHKPYLVLNKVTTLDNLDQYSYYLTSIGRNYKKLNSMINEDDIAKLGDEYAIDLVLNLKNIGYGVATNIKFYDLLTGQQLIGTQASSKSRNQQLFTTFDIGAEEEKKMQAHIIHKTLDDNDIVMEDHNRILCVYQDLNDNIYDFIICINVKDQEHYDFFAYQRSSHSYRRWIKENKKEYRQILKEYD